jgi:hypothetical protein
VEALNPIMSLARLRRFNGTFQRMSVIGIEEDRMFELLAKARNQGNNFVDSEEVALPFGCANQHGHVQYPRGTGHSLNRNKIGHIEVADGEPLALGIAQCRVECYHAWFRPNFSFVEQPLLL